MQEMESLMYILQVRQESLLRYPKRKKVIYHELPSMERSISQVLEVQELLLLSTQSINEYRECHLFVAAAFVPYQGAPPPPHGRPLSVI
jgi:hypothetical protein